MVALLDAVPYSKDINGRTPDSLGGPLKYYLVTRKFVGGILDGLTFTERTTVKMEVGFRVEKPIGGSPYVIVECLLAE